MVSKGNTGRAREGGSRHLGPKWLPKVMRQGHESICTAFMSFVYIFLLVPLGEPTTGTTLPPKSRLVQYRVHGVHARSAAWLRTWDGSHRRQSPVGMLYRGLSHCVNHFSASEVQLRCWRTVVVGNSLALFDHQLAPVL